MRVIEAAPAMAPPSVIGGDTTCSWGRQICRGNVECLVATWTGPLDAKSADNLSEWPVIHWSSVGSWKGG